MGSITNKRNIFFFKGHISIEVTIFCKHTGFISVHPIIYLPLKLLKLKIKENTAFKGKTLLIIHGLYKLDTRDHFKNIEAFKSIPSQKYLKIRSELNQSYSPVTLMKELYALFS